MRKRRFRTTEVLSKLRMMIAVLWFFGIDSVASSQSDASIAGPPAGHWAYRAPRKALAPHVRGTAWPHNDIDRFILARLEAEKLKPEGPADRRTLARRLYYDLIGLPPTPEEIEEFVGNSAPDAVAQLVDRLLAAPQFGERWGRHWLDVVRYAESLTLRGFVFPEAWRYRDYVIDAFNRDYPYDRFIQEQVAGDLFPADSVAQKRRQHIATTFLVLGNVNLEEQDKKQLDMDIVDEQLDTIGKAFLAQTIGCARCHDHKFDPIPTRDYYALAGILRSVQTLEHANVSKWLELPLSVEPEQARALERHEADLAALRAQLKEAKDRAAKLGSAAAGAGQTGRSQPVAVRDLPGIVVDDTQAKRVGQWTHSQYSRNYVGDGYLHDGDTEKGAKTLTFHPEIPRAGRYEVRLAYVPSSSRATRVPANILHADGESEVFVNEQETPPIGGHFASLGQFRFEANGQGYVMISNEGTQGHVIADAVQFIPADTFGGAAAASVLATGTKEADETNAARQAAETEVKQLEARLKDLAGKGPKRPLFMGVKEGGQAGDIRVHKRGSVHNLGDCVPRGFLQVAAAGPVPVMPEKQSGRRELGEWLASPSNPLIARVFVNRAWHWLFGAGLVRTPDNFGTTGEAPSHPELLDYLAVRFMEESWSVKKLVREMVLSRTYQLRFAAADVRRLTRSETEPEESFLTRNHAVDPENRLLWRANRRRLEAEALRDSILFVSGQLQAIQGGSTIKPGTSADYGYQHTENCRSVYVPVFRNALPDVFEAFDFADPSMVTGRRNASTVAPQALFFLNHPFILNQARHAAKRILAESGLDDPERLDRAYRLILGRPPSAGERAVAARFLDEPAADGKSESGRVEAWTQICQALFASVDFRYLK